MSNEIIVESATTSILDMPAPTKETNPRQRSFDIGDFYLTRFVPPWSRPPTLPAYTWRAWVANQSVATDCREFLISAILNLDWKITPRNSNYREELQPTIKYYTDLFTNGGRYDELGLDWTGLIEWLVGDLLDIPFGGAAEIGRKNDSPDGRVVWMRPLDGGTLYPTLNKDFPIVQYCLGFDAVAFPKHAIVRTFMSPVANIYREGWGMAPPEKIYFSIDLLNKGDKYYANLLLDVPTLGILDLADMDAQSAQDWVTSFKTFVNDTTVAFKIPVLYEHNNKVEFIPLTQRPDNIMYDKITHKYAALVCSAYGITPQDINLSTTTASGETLAGTIRSQRHSKSTGVARVKAKVKYFFDRILPPSLQFAFIDYDTEDMTNLGRARLATSQAFKTFKDMGTFSKQELRSQSIQDGLFTISIPDELPPDAQEALPASPFGGKVGGNKEPELTGNKVNPSQGGEGEVKSITFKAKTKALNELIEKIVSTLSPQIVDSVSSKHEDELLLTKSVITNSIFSDAPLGLDGTEKPLATFRLDTSLLPQELKELLGVGDEMVIGPYFEDFGEELKSNVNGYLGKAIAYNLVDVIFGERLFDLAQDGTYNYLRNQVSERISKSLTEYLKGFVLEAVQNKIQKIRMEN